MSNMKDMMVVRTTAFRADKVEGNVLEGYAAVFDQETVIYNAWRERIARGAFADTISDAEIDVAGLWNHDTGSVLARQSNGTLSLEEDDHGLKMRMQVADTTIGRDVMTLVKRGDVNGMSFMASVQDYEYEEAGEDEEMSLYTLTRMKLYEGSAVTFPAYAGTSIEARHRRDGWNPQDHIVTPCAEPLTAALRSTERDLAKARLSFIRLKEGR